MYGYIKKLEVSESYKCLLGILNSNLFWWYLINTGTVLANSYFRFKPDYIKPFPMPASLSEEIEREIVGYVDRIVESRSIGVDETEKEYEDKINALVYSLYDLTEDDVKLIKSAIV